MNTCDTCIHNNVCAYSDWWGDVQRHLSTDQCPDFLDEKALIKEEVKE